MITIGQLRHAFSQLSDDVPVALWDMSAGEFVVPSGRVGAYIASFPDDGMIGEDGEIDNEIPTLLGIISF